MRCLHGLIGHRERSPLIPKTLMQSFGHLCHKCLCTHSLPSPAQEGQSRAARRAPDASLTDALHAERGLNVDPSAPAVPSIPNFSVYRFPVADGQDFSCTFDMGEGWLETIVAAQSDFLILFVIPTDWCHLDSWVPPNRPLACFCQR